MIDSKNAPRLVEAFKQMWGSFPDPMVLVYKDRTILAQSGCQAPAAMKSGRSETCEGEFARRFIRGYWIPVQGTSDVFIHGYTSLRPALSVVA